MSVETLNDTVESRFRSEITTGGDGGAAVITKFANGPFLDGLEAEVEAPTEEAYCEIIVQTGKAVQIEIGPTNTTDRTPGVLIAVVRVPIDEGQQALDQFIDRIRAAFRKRDVGDATFGVPYATERRRDGRWWRCNCNCPFTLDELT